jgi:hypothetical protein
VHGVGEKGVVVKQSLKEENRLGGAFLPSPNHR